MDIYILDSLLRRHDIIDQYVSCVWAERFDEYGDIELVVFSTPENRKRFVEGVLLACSRSVYVMQVETVDDSVDEDGRPTLIIKGPSVEKILEQRVAFGILDDLTTVPKWVLTGPPAALARSVFHDICVLGILDPGDVIPFVVEGSFLPEDTIPEPVDPITIELPPQTVGKTIKDICNPASLGFRLVRQDDPPKLYFDIYAGSDRTTRQNVVPAVVFTPELDNLQNTSELRSSENYKNVAYVFSPAGVQVVYADGVVPDIEGFERRVLVVNADDITSETTNVTAALIQRGVEELAKHRRFAAFDGEIDPNSNYKYGEHYFLGDIVEVRNTDGVTNDMRVTEQIFVKDKEGERAYPTLTINLFIDTGSWLSWEANQVWVEVDPDLDWEDA